MTRKPKVSSDKWSSQPDIVRWPAVMGFWALFIISNVPSQMTSEERVRKIQYWWSVATQIWVVLLIGRAAWEIWSNQSEELPRSGWWRVISMELLRSFLRRHLAGKPVVASPNVGCFLRLPLSWYAWRTSFAPGGVKRFYSCPPSRPPWRPLNFFSVNSSNVGNSFLELNSKRLSKMKKAWKNIDFYMEKLYQPFFSLSNKNQQQGLHSFVTSMFYFNSFLTRPVIEESFLVNAAMKLHI